MSILKQPNYYSQITTTTVTVSVVLFLTPSCLEERSLPSYYSKTKDNLMYNILCLVYKYTYPFVKENKSVQFYSKRSTTSVSVTKSILRITGTKCRNSLIITTQKKQYERKIK